MDIGFLHFRACFGIERKGEALKPGIAIPEGIVGADRVDADSEEIAAVIAQARNDRRIDFPPHCQKFEIGHVIEPVRDRFRAFAGPEIPFFGVEREQLPFWRVGQREIGEKTGKGPGVEARGIEIIRHAEYWIACDQPVSAESRLVEEHRAAHPAAGIVVAIKRGFEAADIDAQILEQAVGHRAEQCLWRLQRFGAAIADQRLAADGEFVAFGVAAEIIVIVEDQDFCGGIAFAPEPCCGKAADARADDDQVIRRLVHWFGGQIKGFAIAQAVRNFERAGVAAAHAGCGGGIGRSALHQTSLVAATRDQHGGGRDPGADGKCHAIQKVASGDRHGLFLQHRCCA